MASCSVQNRHVKSCNAMLQTALPYCKNLHPYAAVCGIEMQKLAMPSCTLRNPIA